jgi:hypothetical protein
MASSGIKASWRAYIGDSQAGIPKKIARTLQLFVVPIAIFVLIAWSITPLRDRLQSMGLFDAESVLPLVVLLVALLASILDDLYKRTKSVDETLARFAPAESLLIGGGIAEVYEPLFRELKSVPPGEQRTVQVFGLTLFSAWTRFHPWLDHPDTAGWKVRMICLSPTIARRSLPGIPESWYREAENSIAQISDYREKKKADLERRELELTLEAYSSFPAIHGFYVGNGTMFISCSHWESSGDELAKPHHFYEKFDASDRSLRAEAYRQLFANWWQHACRTAAAAESPQPAERAAPRTLESGPRSA